jgi:hypothetical protein
MGGATLFGEELTAAFTIASASLASVALAERVVESARSRAVGRLGRPAGAAERDAAVITGRDADARCGRVFAPGASAEAGEASAAVVMSAVDRADVAEMEAAMLAPAMARAELAETVCFPSVDADRAPSDDHEGRGGEMVCARQAEGEANAATGRATEAATGADAVGETAALALADGLRATSPAAEADAADEAGGGLPIFSELASGDAMRALDEQVATLTDPTPDASHCTVGASGFVTGASGFSTCAPQSTPGESIFGLYVIQPAHVSSQGAALPPDVKVKVTRIGSELVCFPPGGATCQGPRGGCASQHGCTPVRAAGEGHHLLFLSVWLGRRLLRLRLSVRL